MTDQAQTDFDCYNRPEHNSVDPRGIQSLCINQDSTCPAGWEGEQCDKEINECFRPGCITVRDELDPLFVQDNSFCRGLSSDPDVPDPADCERFELAQRLRIGGWETWPLICKWHPHARPEMERVYREGDGTVEIVNGDPEVSSYAANSDRGETTVTSTPISTTTTTWREKTHSHRSCLYRGVCVDRPNGFSCSCLGPFRHYHGAQCEFAPIPCTSGARPNDDCNGEHTRQVYGHRGSGCTCTCATGWKGDRCDMPIDECVDRVMHGTVIERGNVGICGDHGRCKDLTNGYVCLCEEGYQGAHCQIVLDVCECPATRVVYESVCEHPEDLRGPAQMVAAAALVDEDRRVERWYAGSPDLIRDRQARNAETIRPQGLSPEECRAGSGLTFLEGSEPFQNMRIVDSIDECGRRCSQLADCSFFVALGDLGDNCHFYAGACTNASVWGCQSGAHAELRAPTSRIPLSPSAAVAASMPATNGQQSDGAGRQLFFPYQYRVEPEVIEATCAQGSTIARDRSVRLGPGLCVGTTHGTAPRHFKKEWVMQGDVSLKNDSAVHPFYLECEQTCMRHSWCSGFAAPANASTFTTDTGTYSFGTCNLYLYQKPVDFVWPSTRPRILLRGRNPAIKLQGGTFVDPGADCVDGLSGHVIMWDADSQIIEHVSTDARLLTVNYACTDVVTGEVALGVSRDVYEIAVGMNAFDLAAVHGPLSPHPVEGSGHPMAPPGFTWIEGANENVVEAQPGYDGVRIALGRNFSCFALENAETPCLHGGRCLQESNQAVCECTHGFRGGGGEAVALGDGYCSDWRYLPEGAYPARFDSFSPLYDADPVQECMKRCLDAVGLNGIDNQAFYLNSAGRCACSTGTCSSRHGGAYRSYKIERAAMCDCAEDFRSPVDITRRIADDGLLVCEACPRGSRGPHCFECSPGWARGGSANDECLPLPCTRQADCSGVGSTSDLDRTDGCDACTCDDLWAGTNCSRLANGKGYVDPHAVPSAHDAHPTTVCFDAPVCFKPRGYPLACRWSGSLCEVPPPCHRDVDCASHGSTSDSNRLDGCACECDDGHLGVKCEFVDPCFEAAVALEDTACGGHGTCTVGALQFDDTRVPVGFLFTCSDCDLGWSGPDCKTARCDNGQAGPACDVPRECSAADDCNNHRMAVRAGQYAPEGCQCFCGPPFAPSAGCRCDAASCNGHGHCTQIEGGGVGVCECTVEERSFGNGCPPDGCRITYSGDNCQAMMFHMETRYMMLSSESSSCSNMRDVAVAACDDGNTQVDGSAEWVAMNVCVCEYIATGSEACDEAATNEINAVFLCPHGQTAEAIAAQWQATCGDALTTCVTDAACESRWSTVSCPQPDAPSTSAYAHVAGDGWCTNSDGTEATARRFQHVASVEAAKTICTIDENCVAFAYRSEDATAFYTTHDCEQDCLNTQWQGTGRLNIARTSGQAPWSCYVRTDTAIAEECMPAWQQLEGVGQASTPPINVPICGLSRESGMFCDARESFVDQGSQATEAQCAELCMAAGIDNCNAYSYSNVQHCSHYQRCTGTGVDENYDTVWMECLSNDFDADVLTANHKCLSIDTCRALWLCDTTLAVGADKAIALAASVERIVEAQLAAAASQAAADSAAETQAANDAAAAAEAARLLSEERAATAAALAYALAEQEEAAEAALRANRQAELDQAAVEESQTAMLMAQVEAENLAAQEAADALVAETLATERLAEQQAAANATAQIEAALAAAQAEQARRAQIRAANEAAVLENATRAEAASAAVAPPPPTDPNDESEESPPEPEGDPTVAPTQVDSSVEEAPAWKVVLAASITVIVLVAVLGITLSLCNSGRGGGSGDGGGKGGEFQQLDGVDEP